MNPFFHTFALKVAALAASALGALSLLSPVHPAMVAPMLQNPIGSHFEISYSGPVPGTFPQAQPAGVVLGDETSAAVTQSDLDQSLHTLRQDVATLVAGLAVQLSSSQSLTAASQQNSAQIESIYRAIGRSSSIDSKILTASDIPDLSGTYLALSGGTLTGALVAPRLTASATSTLAGITLNTDCTIYNNGGKLTTDAAGNVVCGNDSASAGSGAPGGNNTYVQFNDAGSLGGDAGFTYNKAADRLTVSYASTTGISADYATTTSLVISGVSNALLKTVNGVVTAAIAGTDYQAAGNYATFSYPFLSNATSTKLTFSGGLLSFASTTIGNGTATGGLTISGNATTTGLAYFSGSIIAPPTANYWLDSGPVNNVGIGGRLFVGPPYRNTGDKGTLGLYQKGVASWIDGEATLGYYDTRSQAEFISGQGRIAVAAASRSSDNKDENAGDTASIGLASFVLNDATSTVLKSSWAFYGHATQLESNAFTTAMELDTNSYKPLVNVSPYAMGLSGTTAGMWLGVGGEDAAYVAAGNTYHGYTSSDIQPVSVALGIINSVSSIANNVFAKGIVIQNGALLKDANGRSTWAELADGQTLAFKYGGGASSTVGMMLSEANGGSPNNQTHLVYAKTGFEIRGVNSNDYSQENKLLQLIAPATSGATDYFVLTPGVAGSNAVTLAATGTDATVNISLMPKSGSVGIGTSNPIGTLDAVSTHATGVGGIGLVSRDSVNANSNPFIYSYKTGSSGAVANLGLNLYFNSSGTGGQRINSTKNGWAFYNDTRSVNDAQLDLQQVSSSGVLSTFATFATNGNVGIGTTTPGSILSVNGVANFTAATSTFYATGGINLAAGCFAVGGACLSTSGGSSFAYPFASNATTTLLAFNGGLTAFASSTIGDGTQIGGLTVSGGATTTGNAYFAGNVGIGTASPSTNLDIVGSAVAVSAFITSTNAGGQAELQVRNNNGSASTNALRLGALGTSYTTSGAFVQSGAFVDADTSLAGGLSIMARASAGVIRFYTGGATAANESMRITSAGIVGIGTTSPSSKLTIWGANAASSTLAFNVVNSASTTVLAVFNGGNAQLSGTLTQSSDQRLKTNVESLDASTTLAALERLNPVTFNWIDHDKGNATQIGFIAQDVQKIFPDLVSTTSPTALTPDGTLGVNYIGFIAPIIKSIQALVEKVDSLASAISGFAQSFTSHEVHATDKLCVGNTCVTEAQLQQLLASQGMQGSAPAAPDTQQPSEASSTSSASDTASSTSPVEQATAPADDSSADTATTTQAQ